MMQCMMGPFSPNQSESPVSDSSKSDKGRFKTSSSGGVSSKGDRTKGDKHSKDGALSKGGGKGGKAHEKGDRRSYNKHGKELGSDRGGDKPGTREGPRSKEPSKDPGRPRVGPEERQRQDGLRYADSTHHRAQENVGQGHSRGHNLRSPSEPQAGQFRYEYKGRGRQDMDRYPATSQEVAPAPGKMYPREPQREPEPVFYRSGGRERFRERRDSPDSSRDYRDSSRGRPQPSPQTQRKS